MGEFKPIGRHSIMHVYKIIPLTPSRHSTHSPPEPPVSGAGGAFITVAMAVVVPYALIVVVVTGDGVVNEVSVITLVVVESIVSVTIAVAV